MLANILLQPIAMQPPTTIIQEGFGTSFIERLFEGFEIRGDLLQV